MPNDLDLDDIETGTDPSGNGGGTDSNNFARMRTKLERVESEYATLRSLHMQQTAKAAGFDPEAGVTKLIVENFVKDRPVDELTEAKFTEFAKGLGYEPKPAGTEGDQPPGTGGADNATNLDALQQAADRVRGATTGAEATAPSLNDQIAEAESKGEWDKAMALKGQKLDRVKPPPPSAS